jgi:hypothetical protein
MHTARAPILRIRVQRSKWIGTRRSFQGARMTDAMGKMMAARKDCSIVEKAVVTSVETSELNFL